MKAIVRSLFGRLTLGIALLAAASMLVLGLATAFTLRSARDEAVARMVDTDLAGLADIHASGGADELLARVGDRLALIPEGEDPPHYLVADASGRRIGGDIERWPALSPVTSEADYVVLEDGTPVFARATQLSPDLHLVVAREYRSWERLTSRMRGTLLLAGALMALVVIAIGHAAARRLRHRVAGINAAYQAVERGELDRRAPGAGRADELGELAAHANRMLVRIEALVRAHRDMSDHVAHELRTPLMHLDNRLLHLIDRSEAVDTSELLASARGDIRNITRMLDSLLDISASEARKGDVRGLDMVDLSALTANLADLYADSAADIGLRFTTDIAAGISMPGEAMPLSRMVSNLLDNAFKFAGGAGGEVRLRLSPGPRIEVSDNGPGVPEDMRERIFERFQRLPTPGCRGHGLGLALARAIAERHGLAIRVEDARPGARFIIEGSTTT